MILLTLLILIVVIYIALKISGRRPVGKNIIDKINIIYYKYLNKLNWKSREIIKIHCYSVSLLFIFIDLRSFLGSNKYSFRLKM